MSSSRRPASALIKVLISIGIIVVLIGLFPPATRNVRGAVTRINCQNNMKQLLLGIDLYESTERSAEHTSPGFQVATARKTFPTGCIGPGKVAEERLSWMVSILPFIEQTHLAQQFTVEKGFAGNAVPARTRRKIFICPASWNVTNEEPLTNYVAMAGIGRDAASRPAGEPGNGFMGFDRLTTLDMIEDGISNTVMLMETHRNVGLWARGGESTLRGFVSPELLLSPDKPPHRDHGKSTIMGMGDGSCRLTYPSINPATLAAAITIAGGEKVELP